jgi:hypothetical protein
MPTTTSKLGASLFMVWDGIPFINHIIHSMARECVAVIHATAGNTRCLLPMSTDLVRLESVITMTCNTCHHMGSQNLVYVESTHNPITSALADVLKDDWSKLKAYTDSTPHYDVWFSVVRPENPSLQFTVVKNVYRGLLCNVKTGVTNSGRISFFSYIAIPSQMAETKA